MNQNYIYGDYVVSGVKNAFNNRTSWWITKKGCTQAQYCFSTGGSPNQLDPHSPNPATMDLVKSVFGANKNYRLTRWENHWEREKGLGVQCASGLTLERAMERFAEEVEEYPCVELQSGDIAICCGGTEEDVLTPEWLCLDRIYAEKGLVRRDELQYQLQNIDAYIRLFDSRFSTVGSIPPGLAKTAPERLRGRYLSENNDGVLNQYRIRMDVKETEKSYIFTLIELDSRYSASHMEMLFSKSKRVVINKKKGGHAMRNWGDGSFTFYPFQAGIPYYFRKEQDG